MRAVSRVMLPGHPGPGTVCRSHRSDAQKPNSRDFSNTQSQYNLPKLVPFSIISHQVARPCSNSIELMGMMTVFWEPNCWAISCRPRFPASLTWATVLCQRLLPGYSSTSAQVNLEVAEYALSPTYPLMCWIYRQIKRKEGVISGRISETPRLIWDTSWILIFDEPTT